MSWSRLRTWRSCGAAFFRRVRGAEDQADAGALFSVRWRRSGEFRRPAGRVRSVHHADGDGVLAEHHGPGDNRAMEALLFREQERDGPKAAPAIARTHPLQGVMRMTLESR